MSVEIILQEKQDKCNKDSRKSKKVYFRNLVKNGSTSTSKTLLKTVKTFNTDKGNRPIENIIIEGVNGD